MGAGWVVSLDDHFDWAAGYQDKVLPFAWQDMTYNDKVYGLPYYADTITFMYNEKALTDAGIARSRPLRELGPDLLGPSFEADEALRRLRERDGEQRPARQFHRAGDQPAGREAASDARQAFIGDHLEQCVQIFLRRVPLRPDGTEQRTPRQSRRTGRRA